MEKEFQIHLRCDTCNKLFDFSGIANTHEDYTTQVGRETGYGCDNPKCPSYGMSDTMHLTVEKLE